MNSDDGREEPIQISRRQFLALAAMLAVTGCESESGEAAMPVGGSRTFAIGPASRFAADGVYGEFRREGFFLVKQGDRFFALASICTHRRCKLETEPDHSFYCPCHGSTFDPNGVVTEGPAYKNLPVYPVLTDTTGQLSVTLTSITRTPK